MNWIRDQLESRHISQATLAEPVGLTAVQMNKVLSGYRVLQSTEADAIRRYFGYDLPEDVAQPVAIAGRISAGDGLMLVDDHERGGGLSHVQRPAWAPKRGIVGAEVVGSSAEPWALNGDIIFWRRNAYGVLPEDLGRPVVAETEDGEVFLKRLGAGSASGLWSLISINPTYPSIMEVRLNWACRTLAALASDQVVKV